MSPRVGSTTFDFLGNSTLHGTALGKPPKSLLGHHAQSAFDALHIHMHQGQPARALIHQIPPQGPRSSQIIRMAAYSTCRISCSGSLGGPRRLSLPYDLTHTLVDRALSAGSLGKRCLAITIRPAPWARTNHTHEAFPRSRDSKIDSSSKKKNWVTTRPRD